MDALKGIKTISLSPFDLLFQPDVRDKIAALVINGVPEGLGGPGAEALERLRMELNNSDGSEVRVVVFGGGSGLSNIIGGDSRHSDWTERPFEGLKRLFPQTKAVVCVTDNGGSTGELLKDFDSVALGDLRHVLLSSVQASRLQQLYDLSRGEVERVTARLAFIFNHRFDGPLEEEHPVWDYLLDKMTRLPSKLRDLLEGLLVIIRNDERLQKTLRRSHCFGNLVLAAAVLRHQDRGRSAEEALLEGLGELCRVMGCGDYGVLPSTSTPCQLLVRYANGVEIPGEHKLDTARRGVPIAGVRIEYCGTPNIYEQIFQNILEADIIIFAPGSLYSSVIPVLQTPGIAEAVRRNCRALKLLIANIWVQEGETDHALYDPERRFYVSDMLDAYNANIPGGTEGLFREVLCVSMRDIPASILQHYALEGKMPIYFDREAIIARGCVPVECDIHSPELVERRGVIQHDSFRLARVIRGLYFGRSVYAEEEKSGSVVDRHHLSGNGGHKPGRTILPRLRYQRICRRIAELDIDTAALPNSTEPELRRELISLLWDHPVIPAAHLEYFDSIQFVERDRWGRDQKWDNVFSYFAPEDRSIRILADELTDRRHLELAVMVAMGESLLGNYAAKKELRPVVIDEIRLGRTYHLYLRPEDQRSCWFTGKELDSFLKLCRMNRIEGEEGHWYRLLNTDEGFTPPGLMLGLTYAWYVDNLLAAHIEYKMSVLKIKASNLIPNQLKMAARRRRLVDFFREVVFFKKRGE